MSKAKRRRPGAKVLPGTFSGRKGAAWSRQWATDRSRQESVRADHPAASLQETITPPSQEAMARAVEAGTCPFCGAGPYDNLGLHTRLAHGVSAPELREMTGLKRICSERLSDSSRERLVNRPDRDEITARGNQRATAQGAFREAQRASMKARLVVMAERDPIVVERATRGDRLIDIAADFGITLHSVQRILARNGAVATLAVTNSERRARLEAQRSAARAATERRLTAVRDRRLERFNSLGADWPALAQLADEESVSRKSMRAYLAKHGVVLDGRKRQ